MRKILCAQAALWAVERFEGIDFGDGRLSRESFL